MLVSAPCFNLLCKFYVIFQDTLHITFKKNIVNLKCGARIYEIKLWKNPSLVVNLSSCKRRFKTAIPHLQIADCYFFICEDLFDLDFKANF